MEQQRILEILGDAESNSRAEYQSPDLRSALDQLAGDIHAILAKRTERVHIAQTFAEHPDYEAIKGRIQAAAETLQTERYQARVLAETWTSRVLHEWNAQQES